MKRIALITAALLTATAPLAAAAPAFADQGRGHYERNDRDYRDNHRDHRHDRVVIVKKQVWHRGDRIRYDNRRFHDVNYRDYRYNAPPRGYRYVRDNNTGEILLAAIATGVIASIILNN
jgi:Ni/Co efflux regulator RcnB